MSEQTHRSAPHRHTTKIAHTMSLTARHLDDRTGPLPAVGGEYVGRHRKPEDTPKRQLVAEFMKRYTGAAL